MALTQANDNVDCLSGGKHFWVGCVQVPCDLVCEFFLMFGGQCGCVHAVGAFHRLCHSQQLRAISIGGKHVHCCIVCEACKQHTMNTGFGQLIGSLVYLASV